jgi:cardiolipin synthase
MIVGAIIISWILRKPVEIRPLLISKFNTTAQIGFAAVVLCTKALDLPAAGLWFDISIYVVAALTLISMAVYLAQWIRHMGV